MRRLLLGLGWLLAQSSEIEETADDLLKPDSLAGTTQSAISSRPLEEDALASLFPVPKPPPLRLIDSPLNNRLTTDPRINARISTLRPFKVRLVRPMLQNSRGYPLVHGFDTWYLYVVRVQEIRVEDKPLRANGLPIYTLLISKAASLQELPATVESNALMLKGIVDYGDTIVAYFKKEKARLQKCLDSLSALPLPEAEVERDQLLLLRKRVEDSLTYAEAHYGLYKEFRRAKRTPHHLVSFFLGFPFNRALTYSVYSAPYALPQYHPSQSSPKRRRKP
ncbi:MAG: hypothetical protein NZ958_04265 [Bacteroidia bacterium]|nr:hypothetical protein [Bacteroidia bacterium]MDW8088433.1 hypothetical protein [Bacteroidia bacterium]